MDRRLTRLFVKNIRSRSGSKEPESLFAEVGKVTAFDIKDGQGFVEYANADDATAAIKKLEGQKFGGEKLHVEYAMKSTNQFVKRKRANLDSDKEMGRCFKCKERGHIAKNCKYSSHRSHSRSRSKSRSRSRSRSKSRSRSNHRTKSNHSKKKKKHHKSRSRSKSPRKNRDKH